MTTQQFQEPITDLGFETNIRYSRNYPDGFVTMDQIEQERQMNKEIIDDN